MSRTFFVRGGLLAATALTSIGLTAAMPARADDTDPQISSIEKQIRSLQHQLNSMKHSVTAAREEAASANRQAMELSERRTNALGSPMAPQPLSAPPGYEVNIQGAGTIPKYGPYVYVNGVPTPVLYAGPKLKQGQFQVGAIRVTLGGFIAAESIFRTRNETLDVGSNFNSAIPFASSPNYHVPEFRETARQSRFSFLAEGNPDSVTKLSAYYEVDFLGAGSNSNSQESNSYVLRQRQIYATYARSDLDLYISGGQMWSLATMTKMGITQRQENIPLTIDAQYVPGFVWTRNAGLRIVKGFDNDLVDAAISFESPQANYYTGGNGTGSLSGTVLTTNAGSGTLNPDTTYSDDIAPDVIAKVTTDPGFGHFELFGIGRALHDRITPVAGGNAGRNNTVLAGGVGAGTIIPVVPKLIDFQLSGLGGYGIGRYGSAQFPDATFTQHGAPLPLPEVMLLAGLTLHPAKMLDLYGYAGTEQITHSKAYTELGKGYGYGSPLYKNTGCDIEQPLPATGASLAQPCTGNASGIVQGAAGFWYRFAKGDFGTMQAGTEVSYTRKDTFKGIGGAPKTDDAMVYFSFRYLPFQ